MIEPLFDLPSAWQPNAGRSSGKTGSRSENTGRVSDATMRICAALRGVHPDKTAECVAASTGLSADAFSKWSAGVAQPSAQSLRTLVLTYGLPLLIAWFGSCPDWLEPSARARYAEARGAALERIAAEIEALKRL